MEDLGVQLGLVAVHVAWLRCFWTDITLKRCAEPRSSLQLEAEVQEGPEDRDSPQWVTPGPTASRQVPLPECQHNSLGKIFFSQW